MTELGSIAKIKQALELAKMAKTGCSLTLFDVIELLGHIEMLEETIALYDHEPSNSDVSTEDALLKRAKKAEAEVAKLTAEIKKILEEAVFIKFENEDMLPTEIPDDVYSAAFDCSHVDGVRLFPYIEENGEKYFLVKLKECQSKQNITDSDDIDDYTFGSIFDTNEMD